MEEEDEHSEEEEFETPSTSRNSGGGGGKSAAGALKTTGLPSDDEDEDGVKGEGGYGTEEENDDALKELEKYKKKLSSSNKKLQKVGKELVMAKAQLKQTKLLVEQGTNGGKVWWKATKKVDKGKCQNCDLASGSSTFLSLIHDALSKLRQMDNETEEPL